MKNRHARRHPADVAPVFLNRDETARALGVSVTTVDRLVKSGKLRAARIGRRVVCSHQAIDAFRQAAEEAEWGAAS